MILGHVPAQDIATYGLAHVGAFLSVSHPVGKYAADQKKNQKLDTMLVQYFLLKMSTRDAPQDPFVKLSADYLKRKGKSFKVDGKVGELTFDMILNYQMTADQMVLGGSQGPGGSMNTVKDTAVDGAVHPTPNDSQGSPITSDGKLYTIVHMNERFNTLFPEGGYTILTDQLAPVDLKVEAARLLPTRPTPLPNVTPGGLLSMPSYHISRARHFPQGR